MKEEDERKFRRLFQDINREGKLDRMKRYLQHGSVTTYEHAVGVAKMSYAINRRLHVHAKERELVRGALLHDYFLYDWHHWDGPLHGPYHPKAALRNAKRDFDLTPREENIIRSHMWPLTPLHFPKTREAAIVCIADKICSVRETLLERKHKTA